MGENNFRACEEVQLERRLSSPRGAGRGQNTSPLQTSRGMNAKEGEYAQGTEGV